MKTQKFMGKGKLVKRLTAQVKNKSLAIEILQGYGYMKDDGKTLTKKGEVRNNMTARQRAIDRAASKSGRPKSDYKYKRKDNSSMAFR